MIKEHQAKQQPENLVIAMSSVADGNIKHGEAFDSEQVLANRREFLASAGVKYEQANLVRVQYDSEDFCRYGLADASEAGVSMQQSGQTDPADALATDQLQQALFLPIADCCPLVLADTQGPSLMLSHLGRHSLEQNGGQKSVEFICSQFGLPTSRLYAWVGPTPSSETYPLYGFANQSIQAVAISQIKAAGLDTGQVEACSVDNAVDTRYYSHSQFKQGKRDSDGRFAVAAMRKHP